MAESRKRGPDGSSKQIQPAAPALFSHLKCPNCGLEPAIVFPLIRDHHKTLEEAPLVCMACCLEARNHL
jgi:hypothetical protein